MRAVSGTSASVHHCHVVFVWNAPASAEGVVVAVLAMADWPTRVMSPRDHWCRCGPRVAPAMVALLLLALGSCSDVGSGFCGRWSCGCRCSCCGCRCSCCGCGGWLQMLVLRLRLRPRVFDIALGGCGLVGAVGAVEAVRQGSRPAGVPATASLHDRGCRCRRRRGGAGGGCPRGHGCRCRRRRVGGGWRRLEAVPVTPGVGGVAGAVEAVVWPASMALARGTVSAEEEVVWPASHALARGAVPATARGLFASPQPRVRP